MIRCTVFRHPGDRPEVDEDVLRRNRAVREWIAARHEVGARTGIAQIAALEGPVVTRRSGSI